MLDRLQRAFEMAHESADLRERFTAPGADPWPGNSHQFGELIQCENWRFAELVKAAVSLNPDRLPAGGGRSVNLNSVSLGNGVVTRCFLQISSHALSALV